MPSIRRSLIVYFLLLLGLTLGAVGVLIDRVTREALRAREASEVLRVGQEYDYRAREAERDFDEKLERDADGLGRELRLGYYALAVNREYEDPYRLALALLPVGRGVGHFWDGFASAYAANHGAVRAAALSPIFRHHADDSLGQLFAESPAQHPKFFQFKFPRTRRTIRIPGQPPVLPPVTDDDPAATFPRYDTVTVAGEKVRTIVHKAPLAWGGGPPRQGRPPGPPAGPPPSSSVPPTLTDRVGDPLQFVYVQVGRPLSERQVVLDDLGDKRDAEVGTLADETREATTRVRIQLGLIGAAAFAAVLVGGWLLVGRGLVPLGRLSDAVSRVSEKDFRLPVEKASLSRELVPIHDRLTHTLDALRRAFEREKQAVADISHELRTPVAALLTTLDVALRKPRSADQYRETLGECRDISKQMSMLVERIMTLAWLDAGNDRLRTEQVDAADLARGCAAVIRPLAQAHGLTLAADLDPGVRLATDPDKLREVVMNLLHNAVEYNSPAGSIALTVSREPAGVVFEVRDTGIGMTPEVADKVFERFYRADPSRTATGVHAGLGLAIVKEYVARLGGTITVDTAPGTGSTFRVTVPAVAEPAPEPARAAVAVG